MLHNSIESSVGISGSEAGLAIGYGGTQHIVLTYEVSDDKDTKKKKRLSAFVLEVLKLHLPRRILFRLPNPFNAVGMGSAAGHYTKYVSSSCDRGTWKTIPILILPQAVHVKLEVISGGTAEFVKKKTSYAPLPGSY